MYFFQIYFTKCFAWSNQKLVDVYSDSLQPRPQRNILRTSAKHHDRTSFGGNPWDAPKISILNYTDEIMLYYFQSYFAKSMSEMLIAAYFYIFDETPLGRLINVQIWYQEGDILTTSQDVNYEHILQNLFCGNTFYFS